MAGGPGGDRLDGGPGNDVTLGQEGRDSLVEGEGNDRLDGGLGRDLLDAGGFLDENLASVSMRINLATGVATAARRFGRNRVFNVDEVWTARGDDHITGSRRPELFLPAPATTGWTGRGVGHDQFESSPISAVRR